MRSRGSAKLAWSICAAAGALVAGALLLGTALRPEVPLYEFWLESTLITPVFATLGALIVAKRPGNLIGWIFLGASVAGGVQFVSGQYATVALSPGGQAPPGGALSAWLSDLMQISAVAALFFLLLLFPTGNLVSTVSRIIALVGGAALALTAFALAFRPGGLENFPSMENPFGVEAASGVLDVVNAVGGGVGLACFAAAVVYLIVRFRRSRGDERLQIKWFVFAATVGLAAILFSSVFGDRFGSLVWTVGPLGLPISAAVAILRYHLYDIDLIINRTLVYSAVTAILLTGYAGGVLLIQALLPLPDDSAAAVAVSTLGMATLFRPLRTRIQNLVDRRFYRARYDATRTIDDFSARLRQQTDLDSLTDDLLGVVRQAVRPAYASVWLRDVQVLGP